MWSCYSSSNEVLDNIYDVHNLVPTLNRTKPGLGRPLKKWTSFYKKSLALAPMVSYPQICLCMVGTRRTECPQYILVGAFTTWQERKMRQKIRVSSWRMEGLVGQPLDPPYRTKGCSYTYRIYVFQASQGIALYPPNLPYCSQGEGVAGGIAAQAALWRVSRYTEVSLR